MDNNDLSQIKSLVDERLQITRGDVQRATKDAAEATEAGRRARDEAQRLEGKLDDRVREAVQTLEEKIEASQPNPLIAFLSQGAIVVFAMVGLATVFSLVSSFLFWQIHDVRTRKMALEAKFEILAKEYAQTRTQLEAIRSDMSDDDSKMSVAATRITAAEGKIERLLGFDVERKEDVAKLEKLSVSNEKSIATAASNIGARMKELETQGRSMEAIQTTKHQEHYKYLRMLWQAEFETQLPQQEYFGAQNIPAQAVSNLGEIKTNGGD